MDSLDCVIFIFSGFKVSKTPIHDYAKRGDPTSNAILEREFRLCPHRINEFELFWFDPLQGWQGNNGWTCLHLAAKFNRFDTVALLLEMGADPTIRDRAYQGGSIAALGTDVFWSAGQTSIEIMLANFFHPYTTTSIKRSKLTCALMMLLRGADPFTLVVS
jgi:Ankyrin repeats (3 copies)